MTNGIAEFRRFKLFAGLDPADLDSIAAISHVQRFEAGEQLLTEGVVADRLYLLLNGKATVKMRSPQGDDILIDELGPGELLGWGAVIEPHVYSGSAWITEPSDVIIMPGDDLRRLCETRKHVGYQIAKGITEVISRRFRQAIGDRDTDRLRRFKIFADLDPADLDSIADISYIHEYAPGDQLASEGAVADRLYFFLSGRAAVKVRSPEGQQTLIDEIVPGDMLGWSAMTEPYVYTASAWATEPSEVIVMASDRLREICETNTYIGYQVAKGIGEVISRRFGQAIGGHGDLREKDLRAFAGEERVIWDNGELQLTTEAVLIGMGTDSPDVIPLEAVLDVEVESGRVVFHVHGGDARSPRLDDPEQLAALVRSEMLRTRHAHRRTGG